MVAKKTQGFVAWLLDEQRFALPVNRVERVLPAFASSPLPGAPDSVCGSANLGGRRVPVLDLRRRLKLPERELMPEHHFVLVHSAHGSLGFFVDAVQGVIDRLDDVTLLDDPDGLLDARERAELDDALSLLQAA